MLNRSSLLAALPLLPLLAIAQNATTEANVVERTTNAQGQTVTVITATDFQITPPMRDWPEVKDFYEARERKEMKHGRPMPEFLNPAANDEPDGALQTAPAWRTRKAPIVNFAGQNGSGFPPDPTGAAGPNNYVQAVNTAFRRYSKTGSGQGAAQSLASLWDNSDNLGDPIVMYDRHAERWFISQFNAAPNRILIAISQTSDPAGSYYAYSFTFSQFPDYPKYSIWWDGYYMTSNSNKTAVVFERNRMLNGDPTARMVALSAPNVINSGFTCVMPADADGDLPPDGTPCYFFNIEDNAWGAPSDRIKVYEMDVDWNTTSNTSVTQSQTISVATFDGWLGSGWDNIPQPGTSQKLDAGLGIFYFRAQHTRWVDHNSVVLCHGVDVGSNHCAIRWYELRDANDGNWTIYQQGTWNPDADDRFYGSIAMDMAGNIGLGYSVANDATNTYPGLRYTGRLASDPLGQMTFVEENVISGASSQTATNRFGDYAHMALDPDGGTFWFTGEYIGTGGNPRTRIFSFQLQDNVGVQEGTNSEGALTLQAMQDGNDLQVRLTGASGFQRLPVDVIGLDGKQVLSQELSIMGGTGQVRFDVSALAAGAYFVRTGNASFQRVQRVVIERK